VQPSAEKTGQQTFSSLQAKHFE